MSRDVEIHKQRHSSLMFAEFPNQSPSTNYGGDHFLPLCFTNAKFVCDKSDAALLFRPSQRNVRSGVLTHYKARLLSLCCYQAGGTLSAMPNE